MIEIFQVDSNETSGKYYVLLEKSSENEMLLSELTLEGRISLNTYSFPESLVKLAVNPSAPWKAAYMVWKNAYFLENNFKKENRYKNKTIELLALKHNVDPEALFRILEELENLED